MPEVERKMKLRRDVLWESGELKGNKGEKKKHNKEEGRAIHTREVADCKGNLFATKAMTGVGGSSIS